MTKSRTSAFALAMITAVEFSGTFNVGLVFGHAAAADDATAQILLPVFVTDNAVFLVLVSSLTNSSTWIHEKRGHGPDVVVVGFRVFGVEFDDRLVLVRLRTESHAWVLRQDGMFTDQTRLILVCAKVQENRKHSCSRIRGKTHQ